MTLPPKNTILNALKGGHAEQHGPTGPSDREAAVRAVVQAAAGHLGNPDDIARESLAYLQENHRDLLQNAVEALKHRLAEEIVRRAVEGLSVPDIVRYAQRHLEEQPAAIQKAVDEINKRVTRGPEQRAGARVPVKEPRAEAPDKASRLAPIINQVIMPDRVPAAGGGQAEAGGKPSILMVEDNADMRRLLLYFLTPHYEVTQAGSSDEALRAAGKRAEEGRHFDLFLLDINLGEGLSGCELLGALRAMPGYEAVPAVACTAYVSQQDFERFSVAGFLSVVAKPIKRDVLLSALKRVLV